MFFCYIPQARLASGSCPCVAWHYKCRGDAPAPTTWRAPATWWRCPRSPLCRRSQVYLVVYVLQKKRSYLIKCLTHTSIYRNPTIPPFDPFPTGDLVMTYLCCVPDTRQNKHFPRKSDLSWVWVGGNYAAISIRHVAQFFNPAIRTKKYNI